MKKKIALLLCSTGNEAFAVGNVIIGAKKYLFQNLKPEDYDIIFLTDKLESKDENALKNIFPRIIIKIYKSPFSKEMLNLRELNHFSSFTYARFEAFNLLEKYEKVFYVDTDIVIQKDMSYIFDLDFELYATLSQTPICQTTQNKESIKLIKKNNNYNIDMLSFYDGNIIISDKINYQGMTKWLYDKSEEYKTNDLVVLNLLVQEFSIKILDAGETFCCFPNSKNASNSHIIHAIGPAKFWRGTYNKEWEENNKIWIEAGGNITYEENAKKRKQIDKIVWFIPTFKLRDKVRRYLLKKIGLTGR